jgi:hypothetical protein
MTESNEVSQIRQSYEAFNRGDFESAMEHAHPEFELHRPPSGPYAGASIRGHEGVLSYSLEIHQERDTAYASAGLTPA